MRLAIPRLAMMNSLVMGPGTPSVRLSPLAAPASSPSADAPASPLEEPEDEPATSCNTTGRQSAACSLSRNLYVIYKLLLQAGDVYENSLYVASTEWRDEAV